MSGVRIPPGAPADDEVAETNYSEVNPTPSQTSVTPLAMKITRNRKTGTFASTLLAAALMLLLTSCAGGTKYGAANINSMPEGAEIINLKDNTNLGRTPAQVVWRGEDSEKITVQLQKDGYHYAITSFWINRRHKSEAEARAQAIDVHSDLEKE